MTHIIDDDAGEEMLPGGFCGGCGDQVVNDCLGSLSAAGVQKAHWECWSYCNLRCGFCYRTTGNPLQTIEALRLTRAVKAGGVTSLVFAGGDPTLRTDLPELVSYARTIGLVPIVHTNMHKTSQAVWTAFAQCDHVGISIDSSVAEEHDKLRGRTGNFAKVLDALERCTNEGIRVSVRTVVNAANLHSIQAIGALLQRYSCVRNWKLLEFSAIEGGWHNRERFQISPTEFDEVFESTRSLYESSAIEALRTSDKVDAYMMISPDAHVYGVTNDASIRHGKHEFIGSILSDHLKAISARISIDPQRHARHLRFEQRI